MATRIKPEANGLDEQDFHVWAERQAKLLRGRRFEHVDLENLIEEVAALGRAELNAVIGHASVIIEHLLKLERSPTTEPRAGWRSSVREHRRQLRPELTPRLRRLLTDELASLYGEVRDDTAASLRDDGEIAAADALPPACPYTLDRLTGSWLP